MENLDGFFALIVIMLNALDKKWEIDATIIQKKLAGLSMFDRAIDVMEK